MRQARRVEDPAAPRDLGGIVHLGDAVDIVTQGAFAYVADGFGGLQIYEVEITPP